MSCSWVILAYSVSSTAIQIALWMHAIAKVNVQPSLEYEAVRI